MSSHLTRDAIARRLGYPSWPVLCIRFGYPLALTDWEEPLVVDDFEALIRCHQSPPAPSGRLQDYPTTRAVRPEEVSYHPIRAMFEREEV